jgi:hypothetical protein
VKPPTQVSPAARHFLLAVDPAVPTPFPDRELGLPKQCRNLVGAGIVLLDRALADQLGKHDLHIVKAIQKLNCPRGLTVHFWRSLTCDVADILEDTVAVIRYAVQSIATTPGGRRHFSSDDGHHHCACSICCHSVPIRRFPPSRLRRHRLGFFRLA